MQNKQGSLPNGFVKLPLSGERGKGLFVLLDSDDYEKVKENKWYLSTGGYAYNPDLGYMQKILMNTPSGFVTDHKNHNRLDNRRRNLRIVTYSLNVRNNSCCGYGYRKNLDRWLVNFKKDDGKWSTRTCRTEKEAQEIVRLARSGVVPPRKNRVRNKYMPKNVCRTSNANTYYVRVCVNKVLYRKCGFATIREAVKYRDEILATKALKNDKKGV